MPVLQVAAVEAAAVQPEVEVEAWKAGTSEEGAAGLPGLASAVAGAKGGAPSAVAVEECEAPLSLAALLEVEQQPLSAERYSPRPATLAPKEAVEPYATMS